MIPNNEFISKYVQGSFSWLHKYDKKGLGSTVMLDCVQILYLSLLSVNLSQFIQPVRWKSQQFCQEFDEGLNELACGQALNSA